MRSKSNSARFPQLGSKDHGPLPKESPAVSAGSLADNELLILADIVAATVIDEISRRMRNGELTLSAEYLSPRQVASITGISTKTLEAWRGVRRGPVYLKIGSRVRYRAEDIRRWVEEEGRVD